MKGVKKINKYLIIIIIISVLFVTQSALFIFLPDWNTNQNITNQPEQVVADGVVRGVVLTDNGSMSNAGIIIEDEQGNRNRINCNFLSGYYIKLKPGDYTFHYTRGYEFSEVSMDVKVESYKILNLPTVRLVQQYDTYGKGWVGGDLHQHSTFSDGKNNVEEVFLSNINNGLYYGFLSDHNSGYGLAEWTNGKEFVAFTDSNNNNRLFNPYESIEVTTEFGHYQSLGVGMTFDYYELVLRDYERGQNQATKDEIIRNRITYIAQEIKRAGGVAQINHPYSSSTMGFNYWDIVEEFDTIEIWNGYFVPGDGRYEGQYKEQNFKSKQKWFDLLNEGIYLAATGGSDNHEINSVFGNTDNYQYIQINDMNEYKRALEYTGKYSGLPTTYINVPDVMDNGLTLEKTLQALKNGNSFITNGPIIIADINGVTYGNSVTAENGNVELNIEAFCREGLDSIRIVKNGQVVETIDINDTDYNGKIALNGVNSGDWIILEGLGSGINYAITNPIFID